MFKPSCATTEQYLSWVEIARLAGPGKAGFCTDCTPEYAAEMRRANKCDHPDIMFARNGDGFKPTVYLMRHI